MAYTPKTWQCGETITADGLNNIEDGIQEALECCGGGGGTEPLIVNLKAQTENIPTIASHLDSWEFDQQPIFTIYPSTSFIEPDQQIDLLMIQDALENGQVVLGNLELQITMNPDDPNPTVVTVHRMLKAQLIPPSGIIFSDMTSYSAPLLSDATYGIDEININVSAMDEYGNWSKYEYIVDGTK